MQNFGIYIIGDEILSGKREDKHLAQAIQILRARGLNLSWAQYLGDDLADLTARFKQSFNSGDIVFSFGGIGATPDDYTRQAAAAALGLPIARHAEAVAQIEAQFGEAAYPKRVLMADFPQGAALVPNPVNRVAGFSIQQHYFLPGFPQMAWPMMEWVLDQHYSALFHGQATHEASIMVHDAGESQLIDLMNAIVQNHPQVKLFSLPKLGPQKTIELGVKGDPEMIGPAIADIKSGVTAAGFPWVEINSA
jgi:molybdopterin-biosynthesis enzyme MoeA-like protein